MKVAITHTRYTFQGGVERYVFDLVRRLADAGHEVHYFCNFWDEHVDPRIKIHKVPNTWKQIRFMKVWSFDRWLTRNVRREDFDIVHGFSKSSYQDIYTDGSGCLLDYQTYSIDEAGGSALKKKVKRASLHQKQVLAVEQRRFTRGNFHRVVAMSDLAGDQIKQRYGLTDDEVITLYNGIDVERFHPDKRAEWRDEYVERLSLPKNPFLVLCVGHDYRRKGVPALIRAAAKIKEQGGLPDGRQLRICVVGRESHHYERELAAEIKRLDVVDAVRLYGTQDLVERWHGFSDLFVLPTRFDAFGNVVLEAMATGVPALVSVKAGAAEVVEDGVSGWRLEDPDDADTIARRITELASDETKRLAMGQAARAAAEALSWDHHFERMFAIYEEVLAEKQQTAKV
ncbi:MAG: glycosyltransferase family 4 protein [Planctomycetota bacterium]